MSGNGQTVMCNGNGEMTLSNRKTKWLMTVRDYQDNNNMTGKKHLYSIVLQQILIKLLQ